jgi:hypothetical protein
MELVWQMRELHWGLYWELHWDLEPRSRAERRRAGSGQRASKGKCRGIAKAMQRLAKKEGKGKARSEGPERSQ